MLWKRVFSSTSSIQTRLLPLMGWHFSEPRTASGISLGCSLLDGNYRTVWEHLDVSARQALISSLAFLKGGADHIPKGLMIPLTDDERFTCHVIREIIQGARESRLNPNSLSNPPTTVFNQTYDVICPIPSSKGFASSNNVKAATAIATSLSGNGPIPLVHFIERRFPMTLKSTKTDTSTRQDCDAPRFMHYDTMCLNKNFIKSIPKASILLYDDMFTWGNTTEAARNLLLLAGASRVDVLTVFSSEPSCRASSYKFLGNDDLTSVGKERFQITSSAPVRKEILQWEEQKTLKDWHTSLVAFIEAYYPYYVPNDVPF